MNVKRTSWGLVVLFVGLVLLFTNLGYITFDWFAVFSLWPVLLILFGLSFLLPEHSESKYIMIFATLGALALFAYQGLKTDSVFLIWEKDREENEESVSNESLREKADHFSKVLDPKTKFASLKIKGGAVEYGIGKSTDKLFVAETSSNYGGFSLLQREVRKAGITSAEEVFLDFRMADRKNYQFNEEEIQSTAKINLSAVPIWEIDLEIGAGNVNFDLSDYRVRKLEIEGGVSSIKVKTGMPFEKENQINFEGGLASLELSIPEEAACRILSDSGFSSLDFDGFIKQGDGSYITENYSNSDNKFAITIESGLSSVRVSRY